MDTEPADVEDDGDLVYLECKCCHVRVEHRCPGESKMDLTEGTGEDYMTPPKVTRKRRGKGSRSGGKKAMLSMAPSDGSLVAASSGGDEGEASINGGTLTVSTRANREKKTAEDYLRQLANDDLKVTDDGLDIFCVKCDKALSKVALGQRIRIDNLFSHVKSSSHMKAGQGQESIKEEQRLEPTAALLESEDFPEGEDGGTVSDIQKPKGRRGRKPNGISPKGSPEKPSNGPGSGVRGSRQKSAAEYVERLQCPEIQVASDGLNLECIACERLITRLDEGKRIRIDNITTHINSGQHRKLVEKRSSEGGPGFGMGLHDNSEEPTRVVEFPSGSGTAGSSGGGRSGRGRRRAGTEEHSEFLMSVGLSNVSGDGDDGDSYVAEPSTSAAVSPTASSKKRSKRKGIPSKDKGLAAVAETEE